MIRKINAVWNGNGADGSGTLTAQSGAFDSMPYSFKTRFENDDGKLGTNLPSGPREEVSLAMSVDAREDINGGLACPLPPRGPAKPKEASDAPVDLNAPPGKRMLAQTNWAVLGMAPPHLPEGVLTMC